MHTSARESATWEDTAAPSSLSHLGKVYGLLTANLGITSLVAWATATFGAREAATMGKYTFDAPVAMAAAINHPFVAMALFFGSFFAIFWAMSQRSQVMGVATLGLFSAVSGWFVAPSIAYAAMRAANATTLSAHPVRDAAVLTLVAFVSLSAYALISKRDFSVLGGALMSGLMVLIAAGILNLFFGSVVLELALASAGVLVFLGFTLYDTWKLKNESSGSVVFDTLGLYLDVVNIFLNVLSIFTSGKDR